MARKERVRDKEEREVRGPGRNVAREGEGDKEESGQGRYWD